ncbi:stalk domain-containing protein [Paenibacillus sp. CF384]|uniref:stalk domain-containing protein n=1 Tax=Paenibacillus sp. CF384 TaxID=1884382 RepID=UPI00089BCD59|nr:stalk domain-containing protein [Paenibacillus sp. CF384]SDX37591.1 ABC-type Fe3+-hydroxamate transport system, substrate-binding protein [Paenibacillus sp. CF384]
MFKPVFRTLALSLTFILAIVSVPFTAAAAETPISVVLDGSKLSFDVPPQVISGSTMIPYRLLSEKLNAKIGFDQASKKLSVTRGTTTVQLTIGSNQATTNGKSVTLDAKAVEKNGRTLVPLRFLGEAFGLWVNWNAGSKTVNLDSKRTITHAMGKTTLNAVPKRIAVLFNGGVDVSLTLGVKPVGAVESWVQTPWYHYLRADMAGVTNLGSELQPNMEAIVALKPDLIIGSKTRHEKIYDQLSAIAPTIFVEEVFGWKANMQMAALASNKEDKAAAFMADWNKRVADFKSKLGSRANTQVSIIRFQDDNTARFYVTGFAGNILEEVGLQRPKAQKVDGKVLVNLTSQEQIPLMDGDVIFDITSSYGEGEEFKSQQEWQKNPLWKNLKAIKNNKYYKVNDITWNMSGGATAAKMMLDDLYFYFDL